jgi:hypothetical protein
VSDLHIVPLDLDEANAYVKRYHRHHRPVTAGYKFCVGLAEGDNIVGVAIVGLPVSRLLMDGWTLEVRRTCTDGTKNANSMLYGACWRAAKALGYRKLITYTLPEEGGASLRGAGWACIGQAGGGTWNRPNIDRPRVDMHPLQPKLRWEKEVI